MQINFRRHGNNRVNSGFLRHCPLVTRDIRIGTYCLHILLFVHTAFTPPAYNLMEPPVKSSPPQRPHHRRNASSKSNILRSLVSPRSRPDETQSPMIQNSRTQTVPLLPSDHPHAAAKSKVLGERQNNARSPPSSPSKNRQKSTAVSKTSNDLRLPQSPTKKSRQDVSASPKKSRSSTNLAGMFAKINRSNKDLSTATSSRDKENTTPPSSSHGEL